MRAEREIEFVETSLHERWEFRSELDFEIYSLLSLFSSSEALAEIANNKRFIEPFRSLQFPYGHNYFDQLQRNLFLSTSVRLLADIALNVRYLDDLVPKSLSPTSKELTCGKLEAPVDSAPKPLTLREACNKIIHSSEVVFEQKMKKYQVREQGKLRKTYNIYFTPTVAVNGKQRGSDWHALLDVYEFCRCCLAFREHRAV